MSQSTDSMESSQGERRSVSFADQWIMGGWHDAILVVFTPLLLLPLFAVADRWSTTAALTTFATVFALSHHLPGMLRAYGDRALFRRFWLRFILAPPLLIGVAVFCAVYDMHSAFMLAFFWGGWHWMMQSYGFMRIYDAKARSFASLTKWLDFSMCVAWFGFALLLSPRPIYGMISRHYQTGGTLVPPMWISAVQQFWLWGTVLVTVIFLVNTAFQTLRGRPPSPIKLILMAVTFTYYWYTLAMVPNVLVAYALFEMFHDVQYLTIVWLFNRRRAQQADSPGAFTKYLFRQRGILIVLYIAICLSYGSFDYVAKHLTSGRAFDIAASLVLASAMLHYYYDGFIWKIRERDTGETLGIKGAKGRAGLTPTWTMARHALLWSLFIVPLGLFGYLEWTDKVAAPLDQAQAAVRSLPDNANAQSSLCGVLFEHGQVQQAFEVCQRALALDPEDPNALQYTGDIYIQRGEWQLAAERFERALQLKEDEKFLHYGMGFAQSKLGNHQSANEHFETATRLDPGFAMAYASWANSLGKEKRFDDAIEKLERAMEIQANNVIWHTRLGGFYLAQDQQQKAESQFRQAMELDPHYLLSYQALVAALFQWKRPDEAGDVVASAAQKNPQQPTVWLALAKVRVGQRKIEEAENAYRKAIELNPELGEAHFGLGLMLIAKNSLPEAEASIRRAAQVSPQSAKIHHHLGAVLAMQGRYRASILHFRRALEVNPDFVPARRGLNNARRKARRP
jgi:tetratricopeptide (TPR) repeat protein